MEYQAAATPVNALDPVKPTGAVKPHLIVGATGASGIPLLIACLKLVREDGRLTSGLILSHGARLTAAHEMGMEAAALEAMADQVYDVDAIGDGPASGSFPTVGMLIVPCSMKTVAGICSGYGDNLLLRAADVTIKEQRPLVLAARETPLSAIHLRNLHALAQIPGVRIIPPMLTFYQKPETIDDMVYHMAAKLVEPFGVEAKDYRRWKGLQAGSGLGAKAESAPLSFLEKRLSFGTTVSLRLLQMGQDLVILLEGGDKPHVGCTVLAIPRPSLTGDGSGSCTASVLNVTGHKDEVLCRWLAETVASARGVTTVCTGGFHVDRLQPSELEEVLQAVKEMGRTLSEDRH